MPLVSYYHVVGSTPDILVTLANRKGVPLAMELTIIPEKGGSQRIISFFVQFTGMHPALGLYTFKGRMADGSDDPVTVLLRKDESHLVVILED